MTLLEALRKNREALGQPVQGPAGFMPPKDEDPLEALDFTQNVVQPPEMPDEFAPPTPAPIPGQVRSTFWQSTEDLRVQPTPSQQRAARAQARRGGTLTPEEVAE